MSSASSLKALAEINIPDVGMPGETLLAVRTVDREEGRELLPRDILLYKRGKWGLGYLLLIPGETTEEIVRTKTSIFPHHCCLCL